MITMEIKEIIEKLKEIDKEIKLLKSNEKNVVREVDRHYKMGLKDGKELKRRENKK